LLILRSPCLHFQLQLWSTFFGGKVKLLVGRAVDRCLKARQRVAAYALIVDAASYMHFGFSRFMDAKFAL